MRRIFNALIVASILIFPTNSFAKILAECGKSEGNVLYLGNSSWETDTISNGKFTFIYDEKGNPNIIFRDASGKETDAAADGAEIIISFVHPELSEFGLVAIYEDAGVVETYNVILDKSGTRKLFWTANKSRANYISKVSAYSANCSAPGN